MSTLTQSEQITDETTDESAIDQLKELSQRSKGDWVTCTCTDVDGEANITISFETHATSKQITRRFTVPESLPNSNIQQFLDRVDYSVENIELLEGEELWYNPVTDTIRDSPPTRLQKLSSTYHSWWERQRRKSSYGTIVKGATVITYAVGVTVLGPFAAPFTIAYLDERWKGGMMYPDNVVLWSMVLLMYSVGWIGVVLNSMGVA